MSTQNPLGIAGIACVELSGPTETDLAATDRLLQALGFSRTRSHATQRVDLYEQHGIRFLLNREPTSFGGRFAKEHGPSAPSLGLWTEDAEVAIREAVARGGERHDGPALFEGVPAIVGVGGSLIHFFDRRRDFRRLMNPLDRPVLVKSRGFFAIDHLTNNVEKGTMERWQRFYKDVLGFTEVRTFDIRGEKTGLYSYALRSPCGRFCLPINEGTEEESQIEEYLRSYKGAGIQHIALASLDLLGSLRGLEEAGVQTLDIEDGYYDTVFDRVPGVREDRAAIRAQKVLVDGDEDGYLLQIFTQNVLGPIFFEMIQRENHLSFGEGNFGALFRSIERDQERRGVL